MAKYEVTVLYGGSFSTTVEANSYKEAEGTKRKALIWEALMASRCTASA